MSEQFRPSERLGRILAALEMHAQIPRWLSEERAARKSTNTFRAFLRSVGIGPATAYRLIARFERRES